jgi:REP element-mobilizing transposase RayT
MNPHKPGVVPRADEAPAEPDIPRRKHPSHGVLLGTEGHTIVFLTVCTKDRKPWLATPQVHTLLRSIWTEATAWRTGRYVILPDHLHLFAGLALEEIPLDNWVRYWKSQFTKHHRCPAHHWQTDHWDRRVRRSETYDEKWEYVRNNPVRHGLVARPEDWPFQGEVFELRW